MIYENLVQQWNELNDEPWDTISEKQKIEFAHEEGRTAGMIEISQIADKLSCKEIEIIEKYPEYREDD